MILLDLPKEPLQEIPLAKSNTNGVARLGIHIFCAAQKRIACMPGTNVRNGSLAALRERRICADVKTGQLRIIFQM